MDKAQTLTETPPANLEDRIRVAAHQIWETEGRPDGRADIHWQMACEIISEEDAKSPEWLQREAEVAAAVPEPTTSIEQIKKRLESRAAA